MKTRHPHAYVLNVLSDDHPGIVAAVSSAVHELSGNIDTCSETVVWGYFTQIMIVSFPEPVTPETLCDQVREKDRSPRQLQMVARPYSPVDEEAPSVGDRYILTLFGKDRQGVVWRLSQYLAGKDINIIDLFAERRGEDFVMISQLEIPPRWEVSLLQADLEELAGEEQFAVRLQHENIFLATNHLRLTREVHPQPPAGSGGAYARS
jgi:glycine cleavage system transcriptional repressor